MNRLAWNEAGSLLASGSDDRRVLLWSYPHDSGRQPLAVDTAHQANIFGVAFVPGQGDRMLATCAMDYTVQLHRLDAPPPAAAFRAPPEAAGVRVEASATIYTCHQSRVKEVAVLASEPGMFWSAGEDGAVRQYDIRVPTDDQRDYDSPNLLLAVLPPGSARAPPRSAGAWRQAKGVATCGGCPHLLAVPAGDQYLRLYDRRMLAPGTPGNAESRSAPLMELTPPHLELAGAAAAEVHGTHAAFSNRGDKVLVTLHRDHAYCWDTTGAAPRVPITLRPAPPAAASATAASVTGGGYAALHARLSAAFASAAPAYAMLPRPALAAADSAGEAGAGALPSGMLPAAADALKGQGNLAYFNGQYSAAIERYGRALTLAPCAAVLYTNRCLALLKRGWKGDAAEALRDAELAVALDPGSIKAHFRLTSSLQRCGMPRSALAAVRALRSLFPEAADQAASLEQELRASLAAATAAERAFAAEAAAARASGAAAAAPRAGEQRHGRATFLASGGEGGSTDEGSAAGQDPGGGEGGGDSDSGEASRGEDEGQASGDEACREGGGADPGLPRQAPAVDDSYAEALERSMLGDSSPRLDGFIGPPPPAPAPRPQLWAALEGARRLVQRYVGQCNVQTDIKEASFLGCGDALVAAGSDDGRCYIYDAATGGALRALDADEDVCNCVQPHPSLPVLATSGIGHAVKLWAPHGPPVDTDPLEQLVAANQERMEGGPRALRGIDPRLMASLHENPALLHALLSGARVRATAPGSEGAGGEDEGDGEEGEQAVSCRMA